MRELEAFGKVAHKPLKTWLAACDAAGTSDLIEEAKRAIERSKEEKDSMYVWIDGERALRVLGEAGLAPKPHKLKKKIPTPLRGKKTTLRERMLSSEGWAPAGEAF